MPRPDLADHALGLNVAPKNPAQPSLVEELRATRRAGWKSVAAFNVPE